MCTCIHVVIVSLCACRVQQALRKLIEEKTKQMQDNFEEMLKIKVRHSYAHPDTVLMLCKINETLLKVNLKVFCG